MKLCVGYGVAMFRSGVRILFCLSLALILCSCGGSKTAEEYLSDAENFEQAGDIPAAILEVKNAVQLDPENRLARSKLGHLQLAAGDFASALKELEKTRKLGGADDAVNRAITRALIMLGEHEQAATELALHGNFENYDWRRLQATLDLHVGRFEDARDTFRELLGARPADSEVRANLVASLLQLGEVENAKSILNEGIQAETDHSGLWMIKAQLAIIEREYGDASEAYNKVLKLKPDAYPAMLGRIVAAAGLENFDLASSYFDSLPSIAKDDVRVTYLRGVVAEGQGDTTQALSFYRSVIQVYPEHQEALQRLAKLHFESGDAERAIEYLQQLTSLFPDNAAYRKQLGAAQLAAGRVERAFEELDALQFAVEDQTDANLLALLGSAYSKQGQHAQSIESLARAHELEPESSPIAIQLALSYLRTGAAEEAVDVLNTVHRREPDNSTVRVLLILGYAQTEPDQSQTMLEQEIEKHPDVALPFNIRGFLAMQAGKFDAARQDFDRAIEIDRTFMPPYFNLARINMAEGDVPAAMSELERVLEVESNNSQAYLALGELATRVDKPELAVTYWEKALENDPHAGTPRAALARYYRTLGQLEKSKQFIDEAYRVAPYQPLVQYEYAQVYLSQGDSESAGPVVDKLLLRFPNSLRVLELKVALDRLRGDDYALANTLNKLITAAPASPRPYQLLVASYQRTEQFDKARETAIKLTSSDKNKSIGYELLGDISFTEKKYDQALQEYERSFELTPSSQLVLKLDHVDRELGVDGDRLEKWYKAHPEDRAVRFQLAANTHAKGDLQSARINFEALLEQNPDNPVVLNNLAWIYQEIGDQRASAYAEKAHNLMPDNPEVMDTYAWILLANGKVEQALRLLNDAIVKAPENPDIRYHYAKALVEVGQEELAIEELAAVLAEGSAQFSSMAEAQALLQELQSGG